MSISVIILNHNGAKWIPNCLASLRDQHTRPLEIIVVDNASTDGSADNLGDDVRVIKLPDNQWYCGANNIASNAAKGEYLLFLNNDTKLGYLCIYELNKLCTRLKPDAACLDIVEYDSHLSQSRGASGIDLFGFPTHQKDFSNPHAFSGSGCALLVKASTFRRVGGFDTSLQIYADETDLCWRIWSTGGTVINAPGAIVHHMGAAGINPNGGSNTTSHKRFLANRNGALMLIKNADGICLLMLAVYSLAMAVQSIVSLFVYGPRATKTAYIDAATDCVRLIPNALRIRGQRRAIRTMTGWQFARAFLHWPSLLGIKSITKNGFPRMK